MPTPITAPETRFWRYVKKTNTCWLWQGGKQGPGYGVFSLGGKKAGAGKAHRYAWVLHFGPIPPGMFVCHKCDVPSCVRPSHLFLGTHRDNMIDMAHKGRCGSVKKAQCVRGHLFTPENTRVRPSGGRVCTTCEADGQRRRRAARRET